MDPSHGSRRKGRRQGLSPITSPSVEYRRGFVLDRMVDYYKGVEDAAVLEWDVSAEACSTVWEAVEEKLTRQLAALMAEQAQARRSRAWRCSSSVSRLIDDAVYVAEAWASGVPPVSASHRPPPTGARRMIGVYTYS